MLEIDNTIISLDIIEKKFVCDLESCKGVCCLYGDSGAPLEEEEKQILNEIYPKIKPYLTIQGLLTIEAFGLFITDDDGEIVTPLIKNKECAYAFKDENNIYKCAIEKAFLEKKITFQKPVSCHLYPIRIVKYNNYDAVNYHRWNYCDVGIIKGNNNGVALFRFLKVPLIRKYGKEWFDKLEYAADNYLNNKV
jgi:hypothetical protein